MTTLMTTMFGSGDPDKYYYGTREADALYWGDELVYPPVMLPDGTLYMLGLSNDALYTLNPRTGAASRVGSARAFGVGETNARGLAAIGSTLYMVGYQTAALYTLNTTTGVATAVGSRGFGASLFRPEGLAAVGSTLYMINSAGPRALYTLNTTTGAATRVGSRAFSFFPVGVAALGSTLYVIGINELYTVNTSTGVATRVGSANRFGTRIQGKGLTNIGDGLYMLGVGSGVSALYSLDHTTGIARRVGSVTSFGTSETLPEALAFVPTPVGSLYMVGSDTRYLTTVSTDTGVATRVGNAVLFDSSDVGPLIYANDTMYMLGAFYLYTIDLSTGVHTRVRNAPFSYQASVTPGGAAYINEVAYIADNGNDALFTLDLTTGVATRVLNVSEFGASLRFPTGMTYVNGTAYVLDTRRWYSLNLTTSIATSISNNLTPPDEPRFSGYTYNGSWHALASHEGVVYAHGIASLHHATKRTLQWQGLYTIDLLTGVTTPLSTAGGSDPGWRYGINEQMARGLAFAPSS